MNIYGCISMGFFSILWNIITRIFYLWIGVICLVAGYKGLTVGFELFLEMGELKNILFIVVKIFGILFILTGAELVLRSVGILSLTGDGKNQKVKTENKVEDKTEEITNGPIQHCKKCKSTDMKGSSHGYCLHCQHIMHEIMKQQRPPLMR